LFFQAAVLGLEALHDVVDVIAPDPIEVKAVRVQLGADLCASLLIPPERRHLGRITEIHR